MNEGRLQRKFSLGSESIGGSRGPAVGDCDSSAGGLGLSHQYVSLNDRDV